MGEVCSRRLSPKSFSRKSLTLEKIREMLWSSVKIGNCKTLHLASCYRPPNSPQDVLEQFLDSFNCVFESSNHHPNIIVAGDFYLGDIDWSAEVPFAKQLSYLGSTQ